MYHELGNNNAYSSSEMSDTRHIQPHSRCCSASSTVTCRSHTAFWSTAKINEAGFSKKKNTGPSYQSTRRNVPDFTNIYKIAVPSTSTGMQRITTFRPTTDRVYDSGPVIYYNTYHCVTGTAVALWLRCCATNRKVAGSIPAGVTGIFH